MALTPDKRGQVVIRFGGGLNSQQILSDIHERECASGQNFELLTDRASFRPRRGIELAAEAPNSRGIRGFAQLMGSSRSVLIQAGERVYEWDGTLGTGGMTAVINVSPAARLRGPIEANSLKDGKVLIGDLSREEVVMQWDGTTFKPLSHDLGTLFRAKYVSYWRERAVFANVKSGSTDLPHVAVFSRRSDTADFSGTLTTANRPSSSLVARDPFFLPTQNLAPIRGIVQAFGKLAFATERDVWYRLDGDDATNHAFLELYAGISGTGEEEVVFTNNDVLFGKMGGINSLSATQRFGDVQAGALTRWISDDVANVTEWMLIYSPRFDRVYCVPKNGGTLWVLHTGLLDQRVRAALFGTDPGDISPWSKWVTGNSFNFEPTAAMRLIHPSDGLEYVFMGDQFGRVWKLESNKKDDNGNEIQVNRVSKTISTEPRQQRDLKGWVKMRRLFGGNFDVRGLWGGKTTNDTPNQAVTTVAVDNAPVWSGSAYWSGTAYWGATFEGRRLARYAFTLPGGSDLLQLKVSSQSGTLAFFDIEEVGLQISEERP